MALSPDRRSDDPMAKVPHSFRTNGVSMRCLQWLSCLLLSATLLGLTLASPAHAQPAQGIGKKPPDKREEETSPRHFTKVIELIRPRNDETQVEQIPWLNFLWEARLKAAAEGKPIFIWAAGGPPGGC